MTTNETLIKVVDLKKAFGEVEVLKGINIEIKKGEVVVIIGPSGCGKSTFLRTLNLLEEPTGGHIYFDDADITAPKSNINEHRQKIGMVFQQFNLFPHMTVLKNMTIAPMKLLKMSKQEAEERALKLLERVGLADRASSYPSQLSGGQKQRVAIARAIYTGANVVMFDDSLSAVDAVTDKAIRANLAKHTENTTCIIIGQRVNTLMQADNILVLDKGRIVQQGNHEYLSNVEGIYREIVKIQQDIIEKTQAEAGEEDV